MRDPSTLRKTWIAAAAIGLAGLLAACASPAHLQRPLTFREGTAFPQSVAAADRAIAEAKAAGAANVLNARYYLARAEAYVLNAKEEFAEGDPTDEIDRFATIALQAAQEALRIARAQRR